MLESTGQTDAVLALRGLHRQFREGDTVRRVLNGLDLDVRGGECVALLGRSGSGKSTLLNLISGIDRPDGGSVIIAGRDLTRMNERDRTLFRRHHIGFVYQFFNLIPTLTVEENLLLPLELNRQDTGEAHRAARELLHAVGLEQRLGAFPDHLSGGEQQRVAIARALVHQPSLVLADEPTGNLDEDSGRQVLALLERLVRQAGNTMLLVTHSREVARIADRVVVLDNGRVRAPDGQVGW
ncbi:MAG: ABC transporter ATP-binding protein [Gammaproteobacteria bacterium]